MAFELSESDKNKLMTSSYEITMLVGTTLANELNLDKAERDHLSYVAPDIVQQVYDKFLLLIESEPLIPTPKI